MIQTTFKSLLISLAGGDLLGGAGRLNALSANSPIQLIIDDMVAGLFKRIKGGIKVDEDTLAWHEILVSGPGDHFLERNHTLNHCRDALRPDLLLNESWEHWIEAGEKDLFERAIEKYRRIGASSSGQVLPERAIEEMNRITKMADEKLRWVKS
jgi:trimethylamine:corrinoid methyltransferase-like protein